MAKNFAPKNSGGVQSSTATQNASVNIPGNTSGTTGAVPPKNKLGITSDQWIDLGVCLVIPGLLYWGFAYMLMRNGVNFLLSNVIGCIMAMLLLAFLKTVLKTKSDLATPVQIIMLIWFVLVLSIHYLPDSQNLFSGKNDVKTSQESVTLNKVDELWSPDKKFSTGANVRIEVVYHKVLMVSGDTLYPGVYHRVADGNGKIVFKGVTNAPAKIKLTYKGGS